MTKKSKFQRTRFADDEEKVGFIAESDNKENESTDENIDIVDNKSNANINHMLNNFWKDLQINRRFQIVGLFFCVYSASTYLTNPFIDNTDNTDTSEKREGWFGSMLHTSEALALLLITSFTIHFNLHFDSLAYKHLLSFTIISELMLLTSSFLPTSPSFFHQLQQYFFHHFTDTSIFIIIACICITQPHILQTIGRLDILFLFLFITRIYGQCQLMLIPLIFRRLLAVGVCVAGWWMGEWRGGWMRKGINEKERLVRKKDEMIKNNLLVESDEGLDGDGSDAGADTIFADKDDMIESKVLQRKSGSVSCLQNNSNKYKGSYDVDVNAFIKRRISLPTLQLKHAVRGLLNLLFSILLLLFALLF